MKTGLNVQLIGLRVESGVSGIWWKLDYGSKYHCAGVRGLMCQHYQEHIAQLGVDNGLAVV